MLPYTAESLFAQFAQYNQAYWPAPAVAAALALTALVLATRPAAWSGRVISAVLAGGWLWTGIAYHLETFSTLNFAAPAYGVLFLLQGFLLLWTGLIRGRLAFRFRPSLAGFLGVALAAAALFLYPLADAAGGASWNAVRIAGVAPAPTAAFTLGLLLLSDGRILWHPAVLPLFWTAAAAATGWVLAIPHDMVLGGAGLAALGLVLRQDTRSGAIKADK